MFWIGNSDWFLTEGIYRVVNGDWFVAKYYVVLVLSGYYLQRKDLIVKDLSCQMNCNKICAVGCQS